MSGCRSRQDLTFQYPCSFRFPLRAGGTKQARGAIPLAKRESLHAPRGSPREAGGTLRRGASSSYPCPTCVFPHTRRFPTLSQEFRLTARIGGACRVGGFVLRGACEAYGVRRATSPSRIAR